METANPNISNFMKGGIYSNQEEALIDILKVKAPKKSLLIHGEELSEEELEEINKTISKSFLILHYKYFITLIF